MMLDDERVESRMSATTLAERIQQRLTAVGKSPRAASLEATGQPDAIRDILSGKSATPRLSTIKKLANALDTTPSWLLATELADSPEAGETVAATPPPARDLPVRGRAAGAVIGVDTMAGDAIDYVARPGALAHVPDAYVLWVSGESMAPRYEPGDPLYVHPHRPVRIGDDVVVQITDEGGDKALIKRLKSVDTETVVLRQFNPDGLITLRRDQIVAMHRVLTLTDLFGV